MADSLERMNRVIGMATEANRLEALSERLDGPAHLEQNPIGDEGPVGVQITMMVWVRRGDWEAEYSVDTVAPGYDFEDLFKEHFIADCQEYFVEQGEMQNVTEVTP